MRKKHDNITVRLTVIYQKVLQDDLKSSSDENVPPKGSKVRHRTIIHFFWIFWFQSATNKLLAKMKLQNIVDCSNNDATLSSIKCKVKSCPNKAR